MSEPFPDECWYLCGPTASGKTAVGIALANQIGAEILSLDSMAVYRRLDIGTAKPTAHQQRQIPHHLLNLIEPHQEFSLAQYLTAARQAVDAILARGRQPLFVGGTPLYLKALLRGLFAGPPADWPLRRALEQQASENPPDWLHQQLAAVDSFSARRLHPNDTRRLIRALEVHTLTGQPISYWQQQFDRPRPADRCRLFVLDWPREVLNRRINQRVDDMFAAGLVAELQALLHTGPPPGRTALQALGYREVWEHLQGQRDLPATMERVKTRTRQFAKRQLTWYRSLPECRWIPADQPLESILAAILSHANR